MAKYSKRQKIKQVVRKRQEVSGCKQVIAIGLMLLWLKGQILISVWVNVSNQGFLLLLNGSFALKTAKSGPLFILIYSEANNSTGSMIQANVFLRRR